MTLANYPLEVIKEFVSTGYEHKKISLSWINTLSFLVSIYDTDDLQKWILSVQPELFVYFEHNKISKVKRIKIFKEIFESYEAREIWISRGKFRTEDLARFGQSDEIVDYLLDKVENGVHFTTIGTAIEILCKLQIPIEKKERARKLLLERALETRYEGIVQNLALECLSINKYNSKSIIDQIVLSLRGSKNDRIRSGLYYFLSNSDYLNDYIDIFLEGVDYVYSREIFSSSELIHLKEGFNKADSPVSMRKILEFFRKKPEYLKKIYFDKEIGFLDNAAKIYKKDPSILESCLELFKVLVIRYEKQAQNILLFFNNTNSRLQVFQKIYSERNVEKSSFLILGALADMDCIDFFVKEYENGRIEDAEIWKLQYGLNIKNKNLSIQFNKTIVEKFGGRFELPPNKDYEKRRMEGTQRDIELLFSKERFLEEVSRIFEINNKEELTLFDLSDIECKHVEDNFSELVVDLLYKLVDKKAVSRKRAIEYINSLNWDYFVIVEVYDISIRNEDLNFTQEQKQHIADWCYSNIHLVDFKKAIYKTDRGINAEPKAKFLWYFLRKFDLDYPTDVLLDMISFDWFGSGTSYVGIEYLEKLISNPETMKKRIVENLNNGIEYDFILENHIIYCKNYRIEQILRFTSDIIIDINRSYDTRKLALDTISEMSEDLSELEVILTKIKDDFKWTVLETLIGKKINCEAFLINNYNKGDKNDKLKASAYLIRLQNVKGLEFLIEWIKQNEEYPWFINDSPLRFLNDFVFVPDILKLLKISYQDNISQDNFHSLNHDVLEALSRIAINSESNFYNIKICIEGFITENKSTITNINFLYSYLEDLELKFSETRNKDINYVITKFKELDIKI